MHPSPVGDPPSGRCHAGLLQEMRHDYSKGSRASVQIVPRRQRAAQVGSIYTSWNRALKKKKAITVCFLQDCPRTSPSPFTTSAPGVVAVHFCPLVTTVPGRSASNAPTAACSSRRINSSFTRIGSARRTSTFNRTRPTLTRGDVTWSCPAIRRTRWSTPGRMSKRCSTAGRGNDCLIIRLQENRTARPNSRDHPPLKYPPLYRHLRTLGYLHFQNCLCRCRGASLWTTCGISISRLQPSLQPKHLDSPFRPTPYPGSPREDRCCFPVISTEFFLIFE